MSALLLDAGALIAYDRGDETVASRLRAAVRNRILLRTHAMVVAQVWRDPTGRQARLARLLQDVDVRAVYDQFGREAGVLVGRAGTSDPIDAALVLLAENGDRILTSDVADIERLAATAGRNVEVIAC